MIIVCSKKNMPTIKPNSCIINVMRPSILSNEYSHNPNTAAKVFVKDRKTAITLYREYFLKEVKKKGAFRNEVIRIYKLAKIKNIYIMCCCKPAWCHGDIIKDFLIEMLKEDIFKSEDLC